MKPRAHKGRVVTIETGGVYASSQSVLIRTVLGSCIAACLRDPASGIGGMNHFMLPRAAGVDLGAPTRYGIHAMELLINKIMQLGGDRRRLEAKLYGGANVLTTHLSCMSIGDKNIQFARHFLDVEGIRLAEEHVGGVHAMEAVFNPHTGRSLVRLVQSSKAAWHTPRKQRVCAQCARQCMNPGSCSVTLFGD